MKKINKISPAIQRSVLPFLKKNGFYLLRPAMLISLACCNSILDISPQDYLEEEQLFTSTDKVEKAVLGVYEGWYPEYLIQIASLMTDECRIGLQNTGMNAAGQCLFRHTFTSDDNEVLMPWMNYYQTIGRLNRILQNLDQTVLQDEADVSLLAALRAELLGLRAYLHFDLYRIYGYSAVFDAEAPAVPYLLESCNDSLPARPDSRTFFSRLLADLDEAEIDTPAENTGRINAVTLRGLRARMALYLKDYEMAIRAATDVIDARPLASPIAFEAVWTDQSRSEVLFFLYRNNLSLLRPGDLFYSVNEDKMLYAPSLKLIQSYSDTDIRRCWFATDQSLLPDNYADHPFGFCQ